MGFNFLDKMPKICSIRRNSKWIKSLMQGLQKTLQLYQTMMKIYIKSFIKFLYNLQKQRNQKKRMMPLAKLKFQQLRSKSQQLNYDRKKKIQQFGNHSSHQDLQFTIINKRPTAGLKSKPWYGYFNQKQKKRRYKYIIKYLIKIIGQERIF
ncbi:unnamed protein product [Paramecium pentaurelia]|uniref:Uncharacterized protein n=1 Tax=Paramecium pentaurelia TaxID=43138 RepID=A0A8S1W042_9CILI|nr:unnamed protein product [Paramecium pentaurelia]